jgi:hypothetical protein
MYSTQKSNDRFINVLFIATYMCFLMLSLLIMTHAAIKDPKSITVLRFYIPKITLVGIFWIFLIIILTWIRLQTQNDPAYSPDFQTFQILGIIAFIILAVYFINLLYYLIRGIDKFRNLPSTRKKRFFSLWIFVLFIVIASAVDVVLYFSRYSWNNAAQLLSYFAIYNLFSVCMAILFLPSKTVDRATKTSSDERATQDELLGNEEVKDDYEDYENF